MIILRYVFVNKIRYFMGKCYSELYLIYIWCFSHAIHHHTVHGLGYVWTPQVITIEVADTIHWEWSTPVLLETIGYRVEQTETPTAKEASGFKSAAKTYNGE